MLILIAAKTILYKVLNVFKKIISVVAMLAVALFVNAQSKTRYAGDVAGDGEVGISDVPILVYQVMGVAKQEKVRVYLGGGVTGERYTGDVNDDGNVNISDVNLLVDILLGKAVKKTYVLADELTMVLAGHEYVDLGLNVMWATCNLGASAPHDYGDYYAWGEVEPQNIFGWENYSLCDGDGNSMTKYCLRTYYGTISNIRQLEAADDAASRRWGDKWRMPTYADEEELRKGCYWEWTTSYKGSGVAGYVVYKAKAAADRGKVSCFSPALMASYSLSDTHIFMPAGGCKKLTGYLIGYSGYYWTSSLNETYNDEAWGLFFASYDMNRNSDCRYIGRNIRAVFSKN